MGTRKYVNRIGPHGHHDFDIGTSTFLATFCYYGSADRSMKKIRFTRDAWFSHWFGAACYMGRLEEEPDAREHWTCMMVFTDASEYDPPDDVGADPPAPKRPKLACGSGLRYRGAENNSYNAEFK